jgi:serine/threonine protein phosphatase 1
MSIDAVDRGSRCAAIQGCFQTMQNLIKRLWGHHQPALVQQRPRIVFPKEKVADIYAIGDIHGRFDLLESLEARIRWHAAGRDRPSLVICLGDYIDRGPDSRAVIDHLLKPMPAPFYRICICGNHDDIFLSFLKNDAFDPQWLEFGGDRTLESYGVDSAYLLKMDPSGRELKRIARQAVPETHVAFLEKLPIAMSIGKYLFVHAGIVPGKPLAEQSDNDLMWIREPFLSEGPQQPIVVVHGHTPGSDFQYGPNRIGIDTGAYVSGRLKALYLGADGRAEI